MTMSISKHEENMLKLQHQVRQNQSELVDFVKDLDDWTADIRQKDEGLKTQKAVEETKLPPVRNSLSKKKKKKKLKTATEKETTSVGGSRDEKPKKISGYDFKAWDKFDVEKACADIDQEEKEESSEEYETDEEWEIERKKQQAIIEKDKGNEYFKRRDYDSAVECYTKGIELDPTNPLLPANRAMAFLKQEKYAVAEIDCTSTLTLDPVYVKAYLRRGSSRVGLKRWQEAKQDFDMVLKLEPQNKTAKSELEKIEKELNKEKLVSHSQPSVSVDSSIVKAVNKPPDQRSKKPLKRIEIEEIGIEEDEVRKAAIAKAQQGQSDVKKQITTQDNQLFERFTSSGSGQAVGAVGSPTVTSTEHSSDNIHTLKHDEQCQKQSSEIEPRLSPRKQEQTHSGSSSPRELSVPQTSFQFQADYKLLRNDPPAFHAYFKKIDPVSYPKLFGEFLDSDVLLKILTVLRDFYIQTGENYFPHLRYLAQVKRFSMTAMFLSTKEKQVVKELFDNLKTSGSISHDEIDLLAKKYDLR